MAYNDGEALILARIRENSNFDSDNTARNDWKILDSGDSDHYAIVRCGEIPEVEWISANVYVPTYETVVEVWQRYDKDGTTHSNLYGYVANLFSELMPEKVLGDTTGTIQNANITRGGEPLEMWMGKANAKRPKYLKQEIFISWRQENQVSY